MADEYRYKHAFDGFDTMSELLSAALFLSNVYLLINTWQVLPQIIPNHFDMNGTPNGYGSKYTLLGPLIFSFLLYVVLSLLTRLPVLYSSRMTKSNKVEEYRLTVKMIISIKPVLMFVFLVICYFMIQTAQLKLRSHIKLVLPLVLIPIFSHILYWIVRHSKIK